MSKKSKRNFLQIGIFILGFLIFCYPIFTRFYYRVQSTKVVSDFTAGKSELDQEEIDRRYALARAYNAVLSGKEQSFHDPYIENVEEGVKNYAHMLEVREKIGVIRIPKIEVQEPMFAGTSEDVLQNGVGHMELTSLPIGGESTHSVLTGHRGLPDKRIFSPLDKLKEGDHFYIENIKETIAYEVDQIKVIEPSVFDDLVIVPGKDYVTLLTCTPYMINSHRLLVRGHRIPYVPEEEKQEYNKALIKLIAIYIVVALVLILFLAFIIRRFILGRRRSSRNRRRR